MAITTFALLKTAIANTLNRPDLVTQAAEFIALAEDRHKTDVRIRAMLTRVNTEITGRTMALPTGFLEMKSLRVMTAVGEEPYECKEVTPDEMTVLRQKMAALGNWFQWDRPRNMPRHFAVSDIIEFDIDPADFTGDAEPFAETLYYKQLTPLSDAAPSNALLVRSSGAYLYGSLVHSAPYLMADGRIETWEAAYSTIIGKLNADDRKRSGPLVARLEGACP